MNKALVIMLISLTGCTTAVPVTAKFPEAPLVLLEPVPQLYPLPADKRHLSDLLENANKNYGTFYETRDKVAAWQEWYIEQKKINEMK